jgi:hypothetical protein
VIASVDERHIGRGYDPYNSADQPWVLQLSRLKKDMQRAEQGLPPLGDYTRFDAFARHAFKLLEKIERNQMFGTFLNPGPITPIDPPI